MKIRNILLAVVAIAATITQSGGQQNLNRVRPLLPTNYGLRTPQSAASLPRSAVPVVMPERKAKQTPQTVLTPAGDKRWILGSGWELAEADKVTAANDYLFNPSYNTSQWYNATVPGTVLTTLVEQGVYPDPYYGLNNMVIPESLCRQNWWYRIRFTAPDDPSGHRVWLIFNGINYKADVWLNGKRIGDIQGAFIRGRFDVTEIAARENVLAIQIYPPPNPGIPHEQSRTAERGPNGGQLCLDGPTFISSEGWDWIPGVRDRNIGLWQDVQIEYTADVTTEDFQVITDLPLPDLSSALITIKGAVTNNSSRSRQVSVAGEIENIQVSKEITVAPGQTEPVVFTADEFPQLRIENPRLWWPNGYGKQELYDLKISVDKVLTKNIRFGIRELSYELTVDTPSVQGQRVEFNPTSALRSGKPMFDSRSRRDVGQGVSIPSLFANADASLLQTIPDDGTSPYLVIKVNGVRIFCKGGNWGMDDGMKRVSRERLEPYFKLHKDANYTMVRNWTGESTGKVFFDLCDEYGMLVWNDFWMSTEGSNLNPNDEDLFMRNAEDVVRRFVNHPSIAVWCPRNEGYAPPSLDVRLNEFISSTDGTRLYHGNSRYLNLRPSGGWYYMKDGADYFRYQARGFNTELGTGSVPTAATMRKFMAEEDLWPVGGDVWHYHDLHFGLWDYRNAIDSLYGTATDIDDFCKKAQMINFDSHRAMFESWNSKLWNSASGVLLWMSHPAWPSVVWQTYSWDYETFGAYFACRTACEPMHIQLNLDDNKVCVVNTSLSELSGATASLVCYDLTGKVLLKEQRAIKHIAANALTPCFTGGVDNLRGVYLARVTLLDSRGKVLSRNDYLKTDRETGNFHSLNHMPYTALKATARPTSETTMTLTVENNSETPAIAIKLNLRDRLTGEIILPAYFSEGYFNLLPGEKRTITVECPAGVKYDISAEGYNLKSQPILKMT